MNGNGNPPVNHHYHHHHYIVHLNILAQVGSTPVRPKDLPEVPNIPPVPPNRRHQHEHHHFVPQQIFPLVRNYDHLNGNENQEIQHTYSYIHYTFHYIYFDPGPRIILYNEPRQQDLDVYEQEANLNGLPATHTHAFFHYNFGRPARDNNNDDGNDDDNNSGGGGGGGGHNQIFPVQHLELLYLAALAIRSVGDDPVNVTNQKIDGPSEKLMGMRHALDYYNRMKQSLPQDPARISRTEFLVQGNKPDMKMIKERYKDIDPHSSSDSCHAPGAVVDPNGTTDLNRSNVSIVEENQDLEPDDAYFDDGDDSVLERVKACFGSLDPIPAPVTRVSTAGQKVIFKAPQPQTVNVKSGRDREPEAVTPHTTVISSGEEQEDSKGADSGCAIEISLGKVPEDTKGERIADQIDMVPIKKRYVEKLAENMLLLPNSDNVEDDDYETLKFLMLCPLWQIFTLQWGFLVPNFEIALAGHINGILPSNNRITTGHCKTKVSSLFKKFLKFRELNNVEDLSEADFSVHREYVMYKMFKTLWIDGPESDGSCSARGSELESDDAYFDDSDDPVLERIKAFIGSLDPIPVGGPKSDGSGSYGESDDAYFDDSDDPVLERLQACFGSLDPIPAPLTQVSGKKLIFKTPRPRAINVKSGRDRELKADMARGIANSSEDGSRSGGSGSGGDAEQGAGGKLKDFKMNVDSDNLEDPGKNMHAGNVADPGAAGDQVNVTNIAVDGGQENVDKMELMVHQRSEAFVC